MSHHSLLEKIKRERLGKKHPLADEDLAFRYAYGFGVTFLACSDNQLGEEEREVITDLLTSLDLPQYYYEQILRNAENPEENMVRGLIEAFSEQRYKHLFIADLYYMATADGVINKDEQRIINSLCDILSVNRTQRNIIKEIVVTSSGQNKLKLYKAVDKLTKSSLQR